MSPDFSHVRFFSVHTSLNLEVARLCFVSGVGEVLSAGSTGQLDHAVAKQTHQVRSRWPLPSYRRRGLASCRCIHACRTCVHAFQDCLKSSRRTVSTGKMSTVPMMECSVLSCAIGRARCFLSRCIFVRSRVVDGTQATLKTVCLKLEFALNFSPSEPTVVAAILRP